MIKTESDRCRLFLLVRSHSQIQYYFKLHDSKRAANQQGLHSGARADKVAEIHPISVVTVRRRG